MEKSLPAIPAKRYFTIGEVSDLCAVKPYVLRYWEQEFTQLKPMKRRGNRRYYQHHEVLLIRRIRELLYEQGFTISGARNRLADGHHAPPTAPTDGVDDVNGEGVASERLHAEVDEDLEVLAPARVRPTPSTAVGTLKALEAHSSSARSTVPLDAHQLRDELVSIRDLLVP